MTVMGLRRFSTASELKIKFYLYTDIYRDNDVTNSGALNIAFAMAVQVFIVARNKNWNGLTSVSILTSAI